MKHSKKLPEKSWFSNKRKAWGLYMKLNPQTRKNVFGNSFEKYCRVLMESIKTK